MARFADFIGGSTPSEKLLEDYLKANPEWVRLEFKEAKQVPIHGLRKSIAALASTSGGDLFIGIKDGGELDGCSFDPSALSGALEQKGAPVRDDVRTNLVEVVGDPKQILLANGNRVYWLEVPEYGWVVAALNDDGTLSLYERPGANSTELVGLAAVDLFNQTNRARLLRKVYEEAAEIERVYQPVFQGEGYVNENTVAALTRLVSSTEWDRFTKRADRAWVQSDQYLGLFLRLPSSYVAWAKYGGGGKIVYRQQQSEMQQTKNSMADALKRIRTELEREGILPKS